ncbi:MAG: hypothetical protein A2W91_07585 [Bacteroidetes bacterium GWF2_38_335]|nr:MAG: hypothetical protein A2W91_07585 [Bacteroidetes bacterium GWF2_38_335]OFY79077.1 MAG: hypothetical protein A2281_03135 [Bacteroidetes bacterium RIFOXYA12_FULL_38_20]
MLLAGLFSCEKIIDINIPDKEKKIVLNSIITNDSSMVINLSKSMSVLDDDEITFIDDATVKLYEDGVLVAEPVNAGGGNYPVTGFTPVKGKKYKVTASNSTLKSISAEDKIPNSIEILSIDTISTEIEGTPSIECSIEFEDPSGVENYYILTANISSGGYTSPVNIYTMDINIEDYLDIKYGIMIRDDVFNGNKYKLIINFDKYNFSGLVNKVDFQLQSVSKDLYLYSLSYTRNARTGNNLFSEPVQVYSNVKDGLGIFGAYSVSQKSVTFVGYGGGEVY